MPPIPTKTPSRQLAAVGGPVHYIRALELKQAARLAAILEHHFAGMPRRAPTSNEVEGVIEKICAAFTEDCHTDLSQTLLDIYGYDRYVTQAYVVAPDAGIATEAVVATAPEFHRKAHDVLAEYDGPTTPGVVDAIKKTR